MSGKAIDYATTPVSFYKFVCIDPEIKSCYVGSTTNFIKRKSKHKQVCDGENYKQHNQKIYQIIRENGGFDAWRMIEIEKRFVKDKREAERIETKYMEQLQSDMNCKKAHCGFETKQEYMKVYKKEYYLQNQEEIALNKKEYYLQNQEELALKSKERYHQHKEEIALKYKKYYQNHQDEISLKRKERTTCECGCVIRKEDLNRHKKTQRHKDLMETKLA